MRNKTWTKRGRPPGRFYSYDDIRLLEYLDRISVKNEIDSSKFFSSFLDAFQHEEATCGELSIECRVKTRDHAIFLITNSHKVVAQFPIPVHILAKTNPLKELPLSTNTFNKPTNPPKRILKRPLTSETPLILYRNLHLPMKTKKRGDERTTLS